jgi:hypothetical protein
VAIWEGFLEALKGTWGSFFGSQGRDSGRSLAQRESKAQEAQWYEAA